MTALKGTEIYNARLTEDQVKQARIWVEIGPMGTLPQIAKRWGVSTQTLRNACIYKNWKWLPAPTPEELAAAELPDWVDPGKAPHRTKCCQCVHWETGRSCTLKMPEAGGFFAGSCGAFYQGAGTGATGV